MTVLNITPFSLFLLHDEAALFGHDISDDVCLTAGHCIASTTVLVPDVKPQDLHKYLWLDPRDNADVVRTTDGELRFEYASHHADVFLTLAEEHGIRAWDAAAYIAQQVFPELTILDSNRTPITTLDALPKYDGVEQRAFHGVELPPSVLVPDGWDAERHVQPLLSVGASKCDKRRLGGVACDADHTRPQQRFDGCC